MTAPAAPSPDRPDAPVTVVDARDSGFRLVPEFYRTAAPCAR
jgi:hypothetical protein